MLKKPGSPIFKDESSLAIAITGNSSQKHIALLYKSAVGQPMLLHLAWHQNLLHEKWDGSYYWIELSKLEVELQETLADWAVIVATSNEDQKIPYSVYFSSTKNFDCAGSYLDRNDGSGLTCATFILALFSDYGLPLILPHSWPVKRPGDFEWIVKILGKLRKHISQFHFIEQVRRRHALRRFRPEEVLATAEIFIGKPINFQNVEQLGAELAIQATL